jgi:DNA-binding transcriptional LysR family regulator
LYQTVGPRFEDIEAELAVLGEMRGKPAGTVRITATEHSTRTLIWPRLERWLPLYPDIKVELIGDNRFTDIVAERFDVGVRLGGDVAKDMIAVRIAPDMRMAVVGSPDYFSRRPRPSTPHDLIQHDCIGLRLASHGGLMRWEFTRRRKTVNAHVTGRLVFNSSELIVASALAGHGLAWVPVDLVQQHIAMGRLTSVLDEWAITFAGYHAYYATRRASPAVMLVVDALRPPEER